MGLTSRISSQVVLERLRQEPRLRQRVAALAGVSVFFGGVLVAIGLAWLVLAVVAIAVVAAIGLGLVAWLRRRDDLVGSLRPRSVTAGRRRATFRSRAGKIGTALGETALRRARALRAHPAKEDVPSVANATTEFYGWPYAGSAEVVSAPIRAKPRVDDGRRRALELNARGTQLRRAGAPAQAVELHLQALAVFQAIADRHAQATTLNSLALALRAAGETDTAVERFEESLSILREHEEEPDAGKVIANLGFTLLKQGAGDRGRELLSEALEKLPPESPAAQRVEAELRRAS